MSEEWRHVRLGEVADVNPEKTPKWPDDELIRYVDIASVSADHGIDTSLVQQIAWSEAPGRARRRIRQGDVLVSTVRPNLRAFASVPAELDGQVASTGFAVLRASESVLSGFLWGLVRGQPFIDGMVARCTGSNYPAIRASDVAEFEFALPPLSVQRRIVDLMEHLDNQALRIMSEQRASAHAYQALLAATLRSQTGVNERPLAQVLRLDVDRQTVKPLQTYPMVGVANRGQGVFLSGEVPGTETKYAHLNRVASGQVVMRKLTAWEGPIAVVPPEAHGRYASAEFPTFTVDQNVADIEFLSHLCRWPGLWERMKLRVTGTVQRRKRLNPDQLLSVLVPLPPLAQQKETARLLSDLREVAQTLTTEEAALNGLRGPLLQTLLTGSLALTDSYDELLGVAS